MCELVSIIVPIYNVEKYLERCICSILCQTYSNLEIILVNDGSTDNSKSIIDKYSKKDERIIVINKENGGLSDARNAGIDIHSGQYIFFVDSDDFIHPDTINILLGISKDTDADIVECGLLNVNENSVIKFEKHVISYVVFNHMQAVERIIKYDSKIMAWNKLYKSNLFDSIRYPVGKIHEDEFTTPYLVDLCNIYVYTDLALYFYVQRSNSIMNSSFNQNRLSIIEAYEDRIVFFNSKYNNIYDYEMKYRFYVALINLKTLMGTEYKNSIVENKLKNTFRYLLTNNVGIKVKSKVLLYYLFSKRMITRLNRG